jgi:hypothetical protein
MQRVWRRCVPFTGALRRNGLGAVVVDRRVMAARVAVASTPQHLTALVVFVLTKCGFRMYVLAHIGQCKSSSTICCYRQQATSLRHILSFGQQMGCWRRCPAAEVVSMKRNAIAEVGCRFGSISSM